MDFQTAKQVHQRLEDEQEGPLTSLYEDLLEAAVRYARIRANWAMASQEKRRDMDRKRKVAHDRLIDTCNILSRNMAEAGLDVSWRKRLGRSRKEIGDFACHLHCLLGLRAR